MLFRNPHKKKNPIFRICIVNLVKIKHFWGKLIETLDYLLIRKCENFKIPLNKMSYKACKPTGGPSLWEMTEIVSL